MFKMIEGSPLPFITFNSVDYVDKDENRVYVCIAHETGSWNVFGRITLAGFRPGYNEIVISGDGRTLAEAVAEAKAHPAYEAYPILDLLKGRKSRRSEIVYIPSTLRDDEVEIPF